MEKIELEKSRPVCSSPILIDIDGVRANTASHATCIASWVRLVPGAVARIALGDGPLVDATGPYACRSGGGVRMELP